MKILFVGNLDPSSGGPSNVMNGLKQHFDRSDDIKIEIIDIGKLSFKNNLNLILKKKIF